MFFKKESNIYGKAEVTNYVKEIQNSYKTTSIAVSTNNLDKINELLDQGFYPPGDNFPANGVIVMTKHELVTLKKE